MAMPEDLDSRVRGGVYAAQCGMTHPNVLVSLETLTRSTTGRFAFVHRAEDIDKEVRVAFVTFARGVRVWSRYFSTQADFNVLDHRLREIQGRFEEASAMISTDEPAADD
jgi:hypothetical protein